MEWKTLSRLNAVPEKTIAELPTAAETAQDEKSATTVGWDAVSGVGREHRRRLGVLENDSGLFPNLVR